MKIILYKLYYLLLNMVKKVYSKKYILNEINLIRVQIGHEKAKINIKDIFFDDDELWIITEDRPDKSAIIGKGGWVVGKLREKTKINKIHVESYGDYRLKKYKLELSEKTLNEFGMNIIGINELKKIIIQKLEKLYQFDIHRYMMSQDIIESDSHDAVVAASGGVDSSFSLILAKKLGFNPISVTVDPGTIILPNQFRINIENLTKQLNVEHHYIENDSSDIIKEALNGKIHPCGRCSKNIEKTINE